MAPAKKRPPMEMEPGEGKAHEQAESPEDEKREGSEESEGENYGSKSRKRSARGAKNTKAPMDAEGGCCNEKKGKGKCSACAAGKPCGGTMDSGCGSKRGDALTAPEYLAACELGIQNRSRSYIRARLDAAERLDLKCGKGSISQGEKCRKGAATKAQGPSALVQAGQAAKGVGRVALEAGKWVSGYNIGKTIASGITQGQNEKAPQLTRSATVLGTTLLINPIAGLGAARRLGAFGDTDMQQHAKNEKKEKKWRRSVGYKDSIWADGFKVDVKQLEV